MSNAAAPCLTGPSLTGQVAIVTGAGTGIGRATAVTLARGGARVAVCGRRPAELQATVAEIHAIGGDGVAVTTDVTEVTAVEALVEQVMQRWGRIDLLINNHGSFQAIGAAWEQDPEVWWRDVTSNLRGTYLTCRAVLPRMLAAKRGVIINLDGGGGDGVNIGGSAYGCSKAAVVRLSEGLAREIERRNGSVLVFALNPGFVPTAMTRGIAGSCGGAEFQGFVGDWLATGTGHQAEDCGQAILRLLAIAGPELNGCCFDVDSDFARIAAERTRIARDRRLVMRLQALG